MSARRRAKVSRTVVCGHDHGGRTEFGVKLTLAEAIQDLTTLHDAKSERFELITGLLHTCMHRELEQRMDDAADRRARFTLVKGTGELVGAVVDARGEEA